eukprot:TRINITY_DN32107_c0_g1_i1.p1 TRINITY_DN32107_c0_g1~~TRINITY_DN32107_c0_g1_i1.p1  ORF type:complete len:326 (+),score=108.40 TRINITY_DN32107_c0_g1_i1:71-1048(+)
MRGAGLRCFALLALPAAAASSEAALRRELLGVERELLRRELALGEVLRAEIGGARAAVALLECSTGAGEAGTCRRTSGSDTGPPRNRSFHTEVSSASPRLSIVHGFLNDSECDHLWRIGEHLLENSVVVGAKDGAGLRRSRSAYLNSKQAPAVVRNDPVLRAVVRRIEAFTKIPRENFEPIQLGAYDPGDYYGFHKDSDSQVGRTATLLAYLQEPEAGGETAFPGVSRPHNRFGLKELQWNSKKNIDMQPYCKHPSVFKVRPRKGSAVLFWNHLPDLQADAYMLHGACPVIAGQKVVLQQWIRFWNDKEGNVFYNKHVKQRPGIK